MNKVGQMDKAVMVQYLKYVDPKMTNGDIFKMVRDIEMPTPEEFKVDNWHEFYWVLRDHRDFLREN